MARQYYDSISVLPNGKYKMVRTTSSGVVSAPLILNRTNLEEYLNAGLIVGSKPEEVLQELDRAGYVETTMQRKWSA